MADGKDIKKAEEGVKKLESATSKATAALNAAKTAASSLFVAFGGLDLSIGSIINLYMEVDKARAKMEELTGGTGKLGKAMRASREHIRGLAFRYQELSSETANAYQQIAIFSEASEKSQGVMLGVAASLKRIGVDTNKTMKSINSLTKGLGMTGEQAAKVSLDIAKVSKSLGSFMTPGKMAQEFNQALPKLAQYGKGAMQQFYKLAGQAKATGLEMDALLGVAGKFDTFEDAASNVAQLNALLGTQLNSVDMLTASDEERISMLKQSVDATGKSWESMDRFEKKALAGAVGMTDLNAAGQLFSTSMEDMEEAQDAADPALVAQDELNEAMKRGVSIQQSWAAMLEGIKLRLAKAIMPTVMRFFRWITGPMTGTGKSPLDYMMGALDTVLDGLGVVTKAFSNFWSNLSPGTKEDVAKATGLGVAAGVLGGWVAELIGFAEPFKTVFGLIDGLFGGISEKGKVTFAALSTAFLGFITVLGGPGGFDAASAEIHRSLGDINTNLADVWVWIDEKLRGAWKSFAELFPDTASKIEGAVGGISSLFKGFFKKVTTEAETEMGGSTGNLLTGIIGQNVIDPFNSVMEVFWGNYIQPINETTAGGFALRRMLGANNKALEEGGFPKFEAWEKKHDGGELVGPAIIRDDEYVIIPPKGAAAGEVLTPQQAANNSQQPIEMVINIDGREFVRQTVVPTLNKQFNLQGIG